MKQENIPLYDHVMLLRSRTLNQQGLKFADNYPNMLS